jgi:integrase
MARKGNQDRGLFERPSGSDIWWIRYVGPDRRDHREYGGTKTNARLLLARRKTEIADGTWQVPYGHGIQAVDGARRSASGADITLREFTERWLEERTPWLTRRVAHDYKLMLKRMLLSHPIARKPLSEIDDGDVARLVKQLCTRSARGGKLLGARSVNMLIARLRTIFATACDRGIISGNPMRRVKNLREAKPEVDPFDMVETLRLLDAAKDWERPFLTCLLFGGLRPNETLALSWDHIDFEHGLIRVRRNLRPREGLALPETPGSERDVEMSATVRAALNEQRARSRLKGELVFPSREGTTGDLDNFRARNWPRLLQRAKVRPRVLYQCRHTFARLLLEQGDTPQHVAAMLGHTTVKMVFQVYGRWMSRPESTALAKLDAALRTKAGAGSGADLRLISAQDQ